MNEVTARRMSLMGLGADYSGYAQAGASIISSIFGSKAQADAYKAQANNNATALQLQQQQAQAQAAQQQTLMKVVIVGGSLFLAGVVTVAVIRAAGNKNATA